MSVNIFFAIMKISRARCCMGRSSRLGVPVLVVELGYRNFTDNSGNILLGSFIYTEVLANRVQFHPL